jgi:hypothetical protein
MILLKLDIKYESYWRPLNEILLFESRVFPEIGDFSYRMQHRKFIESKIEKEIMTF